MLKKTVLAIAFALLLIQVLVILNKKTDILASDFRLASFALSATGLYYFIFERKRR